MRVIQVAFGALLAMSAIGPAREAEVRLTFVAPLSGWEELSFPESSFSVPRPIVVLDPVVFGPPDQHPGKTTVEQIGPDRMRIRVSGRVYDFLADMVADRRADIEEVEITSGMFGRLATVSVEPLDPEEQRETAPHPLAEELAQLPGLEPSIRPFPFVGRFVAEPVEAPIGTGSNDVYVKAINVNGKYSVSAIEIRATVNREAMRYELDAEIRNQLDIGLHNPVLVYVRNPRIGEANVDRARAKINGVEVGLRFVDGRLRSGCPL